MTSNYVIWHNRSRKNECQLRDFVGLDNTFPLTSGASLRDHFPNDTTFAMDADQPTHSKLTDSLGNTNRVIVASRRLADFFRQQGVPKVEYLPTTILNHKNRPIDEAYEIVHPVEPVDCLNLDGVAVRYSMILPNKIDELDRIVLFEDKIPAEIGRAHV